MTATFRRPRARRRPPFTVLEWHNRYVLINGAWHREAVARRADGALRLIHVREGASVAVAA